MIEEKEYHLRRERVARKLKPHSVAVVLSAKPQTRSNDTEFPYRQNSNFYYLSGFKEDNAALVFVKSAKKTKTYLFVQKKDAKLELWSGKRVGKHQAQKNHRVSKVFTSDKLDEKLTTFVGKTQNIYFDFAMKDERIEKLKEKVKRFASHENIATIIEKLRLIKSQAEIELIRKALSITKEAHHFAMKNARNLHFEYELQAEIEYIFKSNGAYSDAYTSIVASGNAANTLHYISNHQKLAQKDLVLIDAGCEYEYYASDITRTIPVSGKFSSAQKELYSLVLDVEKKIIKMVKPGVMRSALQSKAEELLCKGLVELNILQGSVKKLLKKGAHKKYYPHGIGHWMGIDVHDEAPYRTKNAKEIPLAQGMVLTIEPGIYIDKNDKSVPKKYRGIGIRIEDDIVVTAKGYENLSADILKEIEDIESL